MERNIYEDICSLRDIIETFKKCYIKQDILDVLESVYDYADNCYVSDAEDFGRAIIDTSDVIEKNSYEKGKREIMEKSWDFWNRELVKLGVDNFNCSRYQQEYFEKMEK